MRPDTKALYPPNWPEISQACIERANRICQGCGRSDRTDDIVLTSHHIDYDPSNCADDNLVCLCQGCHLRRQGKELAEATRYHRVYKLIRMGQLPLPGILAIPPNKIYQVLLQRAITAKKERLERQEA
ncbi:hypothetical protein ES703_108474 [subsurface metagenome]